MENIRVFLGRSMSTPKDRENIIYSSDNVRPAPLFETRRPAISRPRMPSMFRFSNLTAAETVATEWPSTERPPPPPPPPMPRPSSSHYGPTPRTANFSINMPDLPGAGLGMPDLSESWQHGPPGHPALAANESTIPRPHLFGEVPVVPPVAYTPHPRRPTSVGHREPVVELPISKEQPSSQQPTTAKTRSKRSRKHRKPRRPHETRSHRSGSDRTRTETTTSSRRTRTPPPRNFLCCLPWIRGRKIRAQLLHCIVSGIFLLLLLTVYLALSISHNISSTEFSIFVILILFISAAYFAFGIGRLCLLVSRRRKRDARRDEKGYIVPRQPIRVVMTRDEEAAGVASEATKYKPPAYGVWRESVRVNPDKIYWTRNEHAAPETSGFEHDLEGGEAVDDNQNDNAPNSPMSVASARRPQPKIRRPPSYISEDGVSYVTEAQPRSTTSARFPTMPRHPLEAGRAAGSSNWL